jgi:multidrug transporter EmrE-like cation transporter
LPGWVQAIIALVGALSFLIQAIASAINRINASEARSEVKRAEAKLASAEKVNPAALFDLYNKQLESYQVQTRGRASWSFFCAVISMAAGFGFLLWGAHAAISTGLAGATVSGLGIAMSAFITKTFLEVHKLSLLQLNHYFKQPVINSHILNAQRLADGLNDLDTKIEAYESLIHEVIKLVATEQGESVDLEIHRKSQLAAQKEHRKTDKKEILRSDGSESATKVVENTETK